MTPLNQCIGNGSHVWLLRPDRETAQFANWAEMLPSSRTGQKIAQFANWATKLPSSRTGQSVAQFGNWATSQSQSCPVRELGSLIVAQFANWAVCSLLTYLQYTIICSLNSGSWSIEVLGFWSIMGVNSSCSSHGDQSWASFNSSQLPELSE